jgi:putative nucleotidyltransferase with HDIG domain
MTHTEVFARLSFLPDLHLVGGAVRDILMGLEPEDLDFATSLAPEQAMELALQKGFRVVPTGLSHGTITLLIDQVPFEITTFRHDLQTDGRRAQVAWGKTIQEDLSRRDFTVGAIAMDASGQIIDPFGGQDDIKAKQIKAVGEASIRFAEDYLRVIRAGRFGARYGFSIEPHTLEAAREAAPKVLQHVAIERVTAEFNKAFAHQNPSQFVRYMFDLGLLQELIPAFTGTDQLEQNPKWHPEGDVFTHVLGVVDRAPPAYRWHALLHDIGKAGTAKWKEEGWYSFHGHEFLGAELIPKIAARLKLPNALKDELITTTRLHMYPALTPPTARNIRKLQAEAGEYLSALEAVCRADAGDRRTEETWQFFALQPVPIQPILQGRDLIERGHKPGKDFSQILKQAYQYQLETGETEKEALYLTALKAAD